MAIGTAAPASTATPLQVALGGPFRIFADGVRGSGAVSRMRSARRVLLALACLTLGQNALGCSLVAGYAPFPIGPAWNSTSALAAAPAVKVERIRRGVAGEGGLCADIGSLFLRVPPGDWGFRIERLAGVFDDEAFPDGFVAPVEAGILRFDWVDGNTDAQEPIELLIRITAMSRSGVESAPQYLRVEDPGR